MEAVGETQWHSEDGLRGAFVFELEVDIKADITEGQIAGNR
jgi:hypothetical protein